MADFFLLDVYSSKYGNVIGFEHYWGKMRIIWKEMEVQACQKCMYNDL